MMAAARGEGSAQARPAKRSAPQVRAERTLPYRQPVGVNDNPDEPAGRPRRRISLPRLIARIALAPLYLTVAVGMVAVLVIFALSVLSP